MFGKIIAKYPDGMEYYPNYDKITSGLNIPPNLAINFLNFGVGAGPQTILCRKEAYDSIGGFEKDMMIGEDIAFSFKMAVHYKVYFLPIVVAKYNKHPESTLSKYKNDNPKLNHYYNQYKMFYLPYIYNENLFEKSMKFKIIYRYCLYELISQIRMLEDSFLNKFRYLLNEISYLKQYRFSSFYLPYIIIMTLVNERSYKVLKKIFAKVNSYYYK